MKETIAKLIKFRDERNWTKFHTPEALSYALSCEAGELLRLWEWGKVPDVERVKEEVADVAIYCMYLRHAAGIDCYMPDDIMHTDAPKTARSIFFAAGNLIYNPLSDDPYIMACCRHMAELHGFNLLEAIQNKIIANGIKYPIGIDHGEKNGWRK